MLEKMIYGILERRYLKYLIYLITLVMFGATIYMFPIRAVDAKMLPGKDSNTFSMYIDLPKGSSYSQTREVVECIVPLLQKEEEVLSTSVFFGEGMPLDFAGMVKGDALRNGQNQADIMVNIEKGEERKERSFDLVHRLRPEIQKECSINGANIKFVEIPAGPPTKADIVAEIYGGKSFESRRAFAYKIADVFKKQKTLVDIDVEADEDTTRYTMVLNKNKLLQSGIGIDQIKKVLYVAGEGMAIGYINNSNAENQIPIFVRLGKSRLIKSASKKEIEKKLSQIKLMNPYGLMIPASKFIKVVKTKQIPTYSSKNLRQVINVIATTDQDSQVYPLLDARSYMLEKMSDEYEITKTTYLFNLRFKDKKSGEVFDLIWDGEMKVTLDTFRDLGIAFIGALVLIYFLMVVYYQRFALAGAIVIASFLSFIGVVLGHWVMDQFTPSKFYLTATSLIGFIALIGINSRNSLLIVDFAKQLMFEFDLSPNKAIAKATATRAKPILLTVLAIVFASSLLATDAVFGGLGVALVGGTLFAFLVSLFFVPLSIQNSIKKIKEEARKEQV